VEGLKTLLFRDGSKRRTGVPDESVQGQGLFLQPLPLSHKAL